MKVKATMNVGVNPAGIAITPNGKYAYVANNNNYSIVDSVTVLDLRKNLPIKTILDPSFSGAYTITINSCGTKAYVTNSGGTTISIIDTKKNIVIGTIDGFDGPSGLVIEGNIGYVNNYGANSPNPSGQGYTVSVVNLHTRKIINTLIVGTSQAPFTAPAALASNGKYVYVMNYTDGNPGTGNMSMIKIKDNSVKVNVLSGFSGPFDIAIKGTKAFVTNFGSNNFEPFGTTVSVVDLKTLTIIKNINVGIQPSGIAITPDGERALVSNYNTLYGYVTPPPVQYLNLTAGQGTVNVIDLKKYEVTKTINVGQSPANIAISPCGNFAYVSNYTSNTVTMIKLN